MKNTDEFIDEVDDEVVDDDDDDESNYMFLMKPI